MFIRKVYAEGGKDPTKVTSKSETDPSRQTRGTGNLRNNLSQTKRRILGMDERA